MREGTGVIHRATHTVNAAPPLLPLQKFLYIVDGSNKAIRVMNRQMLEMVASVGGHAGHNAREFFHIHGVAIDSKGNLFLGEVNNGQRYYKYAFKGMGPAPAIASAR